MNPILSRRTRVKSSSPSFASAAPSISISPSLGRSSPPIRLSSVDLPEPEGPTIETISPRSTIKIHALERGHFALAVKLFRNTPKLDHPI